MYLTDYQQHIDNFIICSYPVYLRDAAFNIVSNVMETVGSSEYIRISIS